MAETLTPRFELHRWSADADSPNRDEFDADNAAIDAKAAGYLETTAALRPAAGAAFEGFFHYATDTGAQSYCDGVVWIPVGSSPDLTPYARKDTAQTFTEDQTIEAGNTLIVGGESILTSLAGKQALSEKGAASGYASLDAGTKLPSAQLPAIVNANISAGAAIAEAKLALASDAAAGTASRRTIGAGALQAAAGNHVHAASGDFIKIAEVLLGSATATIVFSSIPSTYRHLMLLLSAKGTSGADTLYMRLNGDSGANYYGFAIDASGSSVSANNMPTEVGQMSYGALSAGSAGFHTNVEWLIDDYTSTVFHKHVRAMKNSSGSSSRHQINAWKSLAVVNSITLLLSGSDTFVAGSLAVLYGLK